MARRPVFVVSHTGPTLVVPISVEFKWYPGLAISQAQKSISALHAAAREKLHLANILEISSKSKQRFGVDLSSFNLLIRTVKHQQEFSVECAYQSSKVFEHGGPYTDLLHRSSREAKADPRLHHSGRLIAYKFFGEHWDLTPRTAFYDWLYINALSKQPTLAQRVTEFSAFSDIAFNPERSINCQAHAAALFVALRDRRWLDKVLADRSNYLNVMERATIDNPREGALMQKHIEFD